MYNIFIQGAVWIKYWFVTPCALPCFFLFPCFLFLTDSHIQEGQVYSCWSISFCLLQLIFFHLYFYSYWIFSSVFLISGFSSWSLGTIAIEREKKKSEVFFCFHTHFNMLLISNPSLSGPISVQWYQLLKHFFFFLIRIYNDSTRIILNFIAENIFLNAN